jgi:3-hydroxybutyryl-CoA dehydrogenase
MKTDRIGIIGAGLMGMGIAAQFAQAGYHTLLHDISLDGLEKVPATISGILDELAEAGQFDTGRTNDVLKHVDVTTDLWRFRDIDVAIEVVPERLEIKRDLYEALIPILPGNAIIASNTSGFPPDLLSEKLEAKDSSRFLIAHFWNPPHVFPLVEIVPGSRTSADCVEKVRQITEDIGSKPVVLAKAIPGFVGNRLQFAVLREALAIVQSGAASPEVVDAVMKASLGQRCEGG